MKRDMSHLERPGPFVDARRTHKRKGARSTLNKSRRRSERRTARTAAMMAMLEGHGAGLILQMLGAEDEF